MSLYGVLLPAVLSRVFDPATYSAYILGVQVIPFLLLFASPIQASLAPRFAQLHSSGSDQEAALAVRSGLVLFTAAAMGAAVTSIVLALVLPLILGWSTFFAHSASLSILILGLAASLTFPSMVVTTYAAGQSDFLWDSLLKCLGPYLGLALLIVAWAWTWTTSGDPSLDAETVASLVAIGALSGACAVAALGGPFLPKLEGRWKFSRRQLWLHSRDAGSVLLWQLCALFAVSAGPFLVSRVDASAVAAYSIALSLMNVIAGASSALSSPFAVKIASLSGTDDQSKRRLFLRMQRALLLFISITTTGLICMPAAAFRLWVGADLGRDVQTLLVPIALAFLLRQVTAPYTTALLGLGAQREVWLSPTVEAIVALALGLFLGSYWGAQGVAYGLLGAAAVRLLLTVVLDVKLTERLLPISRLDLLIPLDRASISDRKPNG